MPGPTRILETLLPWSKALESWITMPCDLSTTLLMKRLPLPCRLVMLLQLYSLFPCMMLPDDLKLRVSVLPEVRLVHLLLIRRAPMFLFVSLMDTPTMTAEPAPERQSWKLLSWILAFTPPARTSIALPL